MQQIKVGLGILIFKDGKILLGKRKGSHGEGEYASPGGSMEFGESFEESIKREVREEAGIEIENIQFMFVYNLRSYKDRHYVHIQLKGDWKAKEPQVLEPDKNESWDWYSLDNLPQPMFRTYDKVIEHLETGRTYFDE